MRTLWTSFDRWDGLLFGLGLVGAVLFVLLLPQHHPDATLDASLGEDGAVEAATQFLHQNGYATTNLEATADLSRHDALLDSLQTDLGRPRAVAALKGEAGERLPAYLWSVRFDESADAGTEMQRRFSILLDERGTFWHFENGSGAPHHVARPAVAYAVGRSADLVGERSDLPPALTDSLLAAVLAFHPSDTLWTRPVEHLEWQDTRLHGLLDTPADRLEARVWVGPETVAAYARHHVNQSALAGLPLEVDSVWIEPERPEVAHVRFLTAEPYLGQTARTEIEVEPAGALVAMTTTFNELLEEQQAADTENGFSISVGSNEVAGFVKWLVYVALVIVLVFVFIRRINLHLVDVSAGVRDAVVATVFAGMSVGLVAGPEILAETDPVAGMAIVAIGVVMAGLATGVPIFVISSASDSLAREAWPAKQETLTLMRRAAVRNVPVGTSLLRGLGVAGLLLGLFLLVLILFPDALLALGEDGERTHVLAAHVPSPLAFYTATYVVYALFWTLAILLGAGTLLYQWRSQAYLVIPAIVLLAVLTKMSAVDLQPAAYAWVQAGVLGTALAVAFWRYDAVTCCVAIIFFGLGVELAPGWLADGLDARLDALAVLVLAGLVAVVGVVGLVSGRSSDELPDYVPAYVKELAQQERLKRELEIAYQVQESFLPARMPAVEGLDLAAMCLAAHEVGGDYYDVVEIEPGRLGIVIGDVSGKGIQAAFFMTLVKGMWQTLSRSGAAPAEVLRRLNELFCANATKGTFISLIYGVLDVEAGTFTFARAGHNPVVHKGQLDRTARFVRPAGMAIGLTTTDLFAESVEEETIELASGDVLVLYTDGFSEAMNQKHEQFGDERIARRVERVGSQPARSILEAISADVHRFAEAEGRHDDMTMMVVKVGESVAARTDRSTADVHQERDARPRMEG